VGFTIDSNPAVRTPEGSAIYSNRDFNEYMNPVGVLYKQATPSGVGRIVLVVVATNRQSLRDCTISGDPGGVYD
jgi:hypothetical protein